MSVLRAGIVMGTFLKDNIAALLAIIIELGGFTYLFIGPDNNSAAVIALMMMAPTFYYGSSPGSAEKNKIIASKMGVTE